MAAIDSYNSNKIKRLSFAMAFMVLVIHSTYDGIESYPFAFWFQNFFKYGICRVAVPMFFLISGYLFFLSIKEWHDCVLKIKKRIRTLFVPYLLWNIVFVLVYFALFILPLQRFVNNTQVVTDILSYLKEYNLLGLLGYLYFPQPVNVILWYVRDLFVFSLLTPIVFFIFRNHIFSMVFLIGTAVLTMIFYSNTLNGLFFFIFGAYIALQKDFNWFTGICSIAFKPAVVAYLLLSIVAPYNSIQHYTFLLLHIVGVITIWKLYDLYSNRIIISGKYLSYSFWVYCFHMPFYNILKKMDVALFGGGNFLYCVYFVVNPIIAFLAIISLGILVKRYFPNVYGILTGNR